MENRRFFFVVGMPRTRTAWLSVLLGRDGVYCAHEGMAGCETFQDYAAALRRRPEAIVGDCSPALAYHLEELLREFPGAHVLIVRRAPEASLAAICAAAPASAATMRAGWDDYLATFALAAMRVPRSLQFEVEQLDDYHACARLAAAATGRVLERDLWERLRQLRIVSTMPPVPSAPLPGRTAAHLGVRAEGFDFSGLHLREYDASHDRAMIESWWEAHREEPMKVLPLPPLGVVVEDETGPVGALWCFETYGVGVAWIEVPVTRPGLSAARAADVLGFAVLAITKLAGAGYTPRGDFRRFRACCPPAMARVLRRLGFVESAQRSNLLLCL